MIKTGREIYSVKTRNVPLVCRPFKEVHYYLRHSARKQQDAFASPISGFYLWLKYFTLALREGFKVSGQSVYLGQVGKGET